MTRLGSPPFVTTTKAQSHKGIHKGISSCCASCLCDFVSAVPTRPKPDSHSEIGIGIESESDGIAEVGDLAVPAELFFQPLGECFLGVVLAMDQHDLLGIPLASSEP